MRLEKIIYTLLALFLLPAIAQAQPRTIHAEWNYQFSDSVAGYRLYHANSLACEINNPSATSINCDIDAPDGATWFTITSFLADGTESPHSAPLTYIFSNELLAAITVDKTSGTSPLTVAFNASASVGSISAYEWTFGDGETAAGNYVTHTFASQGSYTVTLKVTDGTGAIDQATKLITVNAPPSTNTPPTAVIASSQSVGSAPLVVRFDGIGSHDNNGTIVSYEWDLGDGSTASGPQISHTYITAGSFNPTLTVTDNGGLTNSTSTPVIVQPATNTNIVPTAAISASANRGKIPLKITFSGTKSNDPDGSITRYSWNFGDGGTATGKTVKHTFTTAASYTVTLSVTDDAGAISPPAKFIIKVEDENTPQSTNGGNMLPIINFLLSKP